MRWLETLCMKGLILTHLGRRDEGLELVKQGVRLDLTSHICWHVFGLIQKGQKNYDEALKSYTQALRFDKVCAPSDVYVCAALQHIRGLHLHLCLYHAKSVAPRAVVFPYLRRAHPIKGWFGRFHIPISSRLLFGSLWYSPGRFRVCATLARSMSAYIT